MLYRIYYIENTDMHLSPYYLIEYTSIENKLHLQRAQSTCKYDVQGGSL